VLATRRRCDEEIHSQPAAAGGGRSADEGVSGLKRTGARAAPACRPRLRRSSPRPGGRYPWPDPPRR
jgi:hypothetical protein